MKSQMVKGYFYTCFLMQCKIYLLYYKPIHILAKYPGLIQDILRIKNVQKCYEIFLVSARVCAKML
jgi:hypothetical protein